MDRTEEREMGKLESTCIVRSNLKTEQFLSGRTCATVATGDRCNRMSKLLGLGGTCSLLKIFLTLDRPPFFPSSILPVERVIKGSFVIVDAPSNHNPLSVLLPVEMRFFYKRNLCGIYSSGSLLRRFLTLLVGKLFESSRVFTKN